MAYSLTANKASPLLLEYSKLFEQVDEHYDEFASPPDFAMALRHAQARRVCWQEAPARQLMVNPASPTRSISGEVCPCCGLPISNMQLNLCCQNQSLSHLGVTFPLYFQYIKKCAVLLIVQMLISGVYDLATNINGHTCDERFSSTIICNASLLNCLSNERAKMLSAQAVLNFFSLLVTIVLIEVFKVMQQIERYQIENHRITAADYTLEVSGFSAHTSVDELRAFVEHQVNGVGEDDVQICKMYCIYNMEQYVSLYRLRKELYQRKNQLMADIRRCDAKMQISIAIANDDQQERMLRQVMRNEMQIQLIIQLLIENKRQMDEFITTFQREKAGRFSGRAIITLNSHYHSKLLLRKWSRQLIDQWWMACYKNGFMVTEAQIRLKRFIYKGQLIVVKRAAEPSDYMWTNLGTMKSKLQRRIMINMIIGSILAVCFCAMLFMKRHIKDQQHLHESSSVNIELSFVASTIVAGANTLVGFSIRSFAGMATHKRYTSYFVQVGSNLSTLFFINMVCTTLFSNMLTLDPSLQNITGFPFNLEDLISDFFFLFITNTYLSSLFNYFDIVYGYKKLRRWLALKDGKFCSLSQQEAHQLFEGHQVDIALRYANVQKVMFFTAAVVHIHQRVGNRVLLSIMGLFICYWVDKYLLLRRYVCPFYIDKRLANKMVDMLPLYALYYSLGSLSIMFIPVLSNQSIAQFEWPEFYASPYFYLSLFGFLLSLVYCYVSKIQFIQGWYFRLLKIRVPRKTVQQPYQQSNLQIDYDNFHPVAMSTSAPSALLKEIKSESML